MTRTRFSQVLIGMANAGLALAVFLALTLRSFGGNCTFDDGHLCGFRAFLSPSRLGQGLGSPLKIMAGLGARQLRGPCAKAGQ